MKYRILDKDELTKIIAGEINVPSRLVEPSALADHALTPLAPQKSILVFVVQVWALIVMCGLSIAWSFHLGSYWLYGLSMGLTGATLGVIAFFSILAGYRQAVKNLAHDLKPAVEELKYLNTYLGAATKKLDRRTRRYIHCLTCNNIANFLILMNMKQALAEKLQRVEECVNAGSYNDLREADQALRSPIVFYDGPTPGTGNLHQLKITRLADVVDYLTTNLERSLNNFESALTLSYEVSDITSAPYSR